MRCKKDTLSVFIEGPFALKLLSIFQHLLSINSKISTRWGVDQDPIILDKDYRFIAKL